MEAKVALLALVIFFLVAAPPAYSETRGFGAAMTRREPSINFTRAARKSQERLSMLTARFDATTGRVSAPQAPLRLDAGGAAYDMTLSIGTPPQRVLALADTGSDLVWIKCGACLHCSPQGSPSYYPNKSSSFSKLPCSASLCGALKSESLAACSPGGEECDYRYSYGLAADPHHYTQGYLGNETFTLGGDAVPGIGFGCTNMSEGGYGTQGSGLVGLGRGPLSLLSQLNAGAFSYCLPTKASKSSPLLFGALAALSGAGVQSTPLLPSSIFYIVDLKFISIGSKTTTGTGTAGVIFDSGTTVTFLAEPAYTAALEAVLRQTRLPQTAGIAGFEACFEKKRHKAGIDDDDESDSWKTAIPSMTLHFDGADMALPQENYFGEVARGVVCWIVQKSPSLSIIGNIMQMSFHIRHDVEQAVLSFQPANCDKFRMKKD
ncbi:Aspartic proteinase nepenthesin-1 [Dichanthelium oligosanthes]|uniref:Aspartic proteinase nepenthesin-1 n=1 Tax=Dichanthelium oligosanthes TaxID=888268 RepID=A0A1E5UXC5_9POAL|nr:Aspartic proteinase nepenthesin-1 [Dichanthelium oligosanthes]